LREAFEAERSFAANAAHELRTPLAGAIAQAQRLRAETQEPATGARAAEIEATLKRLTRLSERLMQLARAEGGRLRMDRSADLRAVAHVVVDDLGRAIAKDRIALALPGTAVMSDIDPDAFAILCRNLLENALRHGAENTTVDVALTADGLLSVANDGPVLPRDTLDRLTARFERANANADGSGLGLAIVVAIADRIGSSLVLESPRPGASSGFQASIRLPTEVPDTTARRDG
jgi:two-component system OmpR family sensor kinase